MENTKKKIIIASPFFYPELISTGKYNTFLSKNLILNKQEITVICSYPFYPSWQPEYTAKSLPGIKIKRGGLKIRYPKSAILRRLVLEFWFAWHFFKEAKKENETIDIFVAIAPPIFFTGLMNFFFRDITKIVIIHDLLGVMATSSEGLSRRVIANVVKKIEAFLFRRFDKVICLTESMQDELINEYGLKKKQCEVHYPFATLDMSTHKIDDLLKSLFPREFFHLVYSGALGEKQKPKMLYQFFAEACDRQPNVCCHFFSQGHVFEQLKAYNANERIKFHGLVPESQLQALYEFSDIQVVPQAEGTGAGAFPSKIPNLIAAGVPVIAICDQGTELEKVVRETDIGKVVNNWDKDLFIRALDSLIADMDKKNRVVKKVEVHATIKRKFDINRLVSSIIEG
ncbi:MAG: glycosyltransferase family 4 protein [Desulfobacteraceae bacterium]|nr:glycosyltransferase family 4 protein [Desulfobacteraceae bacterium]